MSGKAVGKAFDIEGISSTEKFVLVAYADHANHEGGDIWPAVQSIADKTGLSKRSVQRATKKLEELKILLPDGKGPKGTNKWKIDMSWGVTESHPDKLSGVSDSPEGGDTDDARGDTGSQSLDDRESPEPLTIEKEPSEEPVNPQADMVGALSKVTGMDYKISRIAGRLAKRAKELREAKYTPEFIDQHYSPGGWWYQHDWRGQKGNAPTPEQIIDTVGQIGMDNGRPSEKEPAGYAGIREWLAEQEEHE